MLAPTFLPLKLPLWRGVKGRDSVFVVVVVADLTNPVLLKGSNRLIRGHNICKRAGWDQQISPSCCNTCRWGRMDQRRGCSPLVISHGKDWSGLKHGCRMKEAVDIYKFFRKHKSSTDCTKGKGLETTFLRHLGKLQRDGAGLFLFSSRSTWPVLVQFTVPSQGLEYQYSRKSQNLNCLFLLCFVKQM